MAKGIFVCRSVLVIALCLLTLVSCKALSHPQERSAADARASAHQLLQEMDERLTQNLLALMRQEMRQKLMWMEQQLGAIESHRLAREQIKQIETQLAMLEHKNAHEQLQFMEDMTERLAKMWLALHPDEGEYTTFEEQWAGIIYKVKRVLIKYREAH